MAAREEGRRTELPARTRLARARTVRPVDPGRASGTRGLPFASRGRLLGLGHRRPGCRPGAAAASCTPRVVDRTGRLLLRVVLLFGLLWVSWARPLVAEEARLRIVAQRDFARLALDSPAARATALEVVGGVAQLRLDRPVVTSTLGVPAAARPWLLAVEERDGGTRLALALAPGALARLVEPGPGRVVVDLVHQPGGADPVRPEPVGSLSPRRTPVEVATADPVLRVRTGRHAGFERLVVEGPAVSGLELRLEAGRIELAGPPPSLPPVAAALQRLGSVVGPVTVEGDRLRAELTPGATVLRRRGRRDQLLLDLYGPPAPGGSVKPGAEATATPRPTPSEPPAAGAARASGSGEAAERGAPSSSGCPRARDPAALCVAVRTTPTTAELLLAVEPRPGAAVFWRAGALWVVLDRPIHEVEIATAASGSEPLVRGVRREPHPTATLLRVETSGPVAADVDPSERGWTLRLRPAGEEPVVEPGRVVRLEDPPALAIEADAGLVVLPAALLGSEVTVLAAKDELEGVGPRRFVDVEFLAAAQGAAWRAVSDDLRVRRLGKRWLIDRPGGLRLTPLAAERPEPAPRGAANLPGLGDAASATASEASARTEPLVGSSSRLPPSSGGAAARGAVAAAVQSGPLAQPGAPAAERHMASDAPGTAEPAPPSASAPPASASAPIVTSSPPNPAAFPAGTGAPGRAGRPSEGPAAPEPPIGLAQLGSGNDSAAGGSLAGLLERRAAPEPEARAAIDRELAREALAQGRAAEALALLGEPAAASDPEAPPPTDAATRALAGVAAILADRLAAGERLLDDPRLSGDPEVALWRAIAAARRADWPRAAEALAASGRTFEAYPARLRRRLAPVVGRILVEGGKPEAASAVLDAAKREEPEPREAARIALVEGLVQLRRGALEGAAAAFRVAAEGGDPVSAVEARYHAARLVHGRDRRDPAGLLAELGRQRLLWRDHPAEPEMLADLVELTAAAGRYGEALGLARDLLARYPGAAGSARVAERRGAWFRAVLEGGGERPADALESLRILRTHTELLPQGEAGAALVRALARQLAAVGLPGVAAAVLVEHGLPRVAGAARAELALEAAELRLQAGDRAGASALLDAEGGGLATAPAATRARAASLRRAASSADPANGPAAGLDPAGLARFEAAWRQRDWRTAAESGAALLAGTDLFDPAIRRLVLRVALALAADGRSEAAREWMARLGPDADGPEARLVGLVAGRSALDGDALDVAAAIDGELAALRSELGRGR